MIDYTYTIYSNEFLEINIDILAKWEQKKNIWFNPTKNTKAIPNSRWESSESATTRQFVTGKRRERRFSKPQSVCGMLTRKFYRQTGFIDCQIQTGYFITR